MWQQGWRDQVWSRLDTQWDLIIIGGGITGAGILCEATRSGLKALLVEAHDFASGTSSRSSKMVHGGMRYLKNLQFKITLESVTERDHLIAQGKGLINRMEILFTSFKGDKVPGWQMGLGLILYGLMARKWQYDYYGAETVKALCPIIQNDQLQGGYPYFDAQTDDARLTLRVIREAIHDGGTAVNYVRAQDLLRDKKGKVRGVVLQDMAPNHRGRTAEVQASVVISAAGVWADELRSHLGLAERLRPLRGSHLVFPRERLPLDCAISINHPYDGRSVFAFPWEGVTIAGTTDVDVGHALCTDPAISQAEAEYLLDFVGFAFPGQELDFRDVISTWSGIRPVINTGKANPSKESREHAIWLENGLLTVTGGKLTTFRVMAHDALHAIKKLLPERHVIDKKQPMLHPVPSEVMLAKPSLRPETVLRLAGRYGADGLEILTNACPEELTFIENTPYLWTELRWAACSEGVVHLDDLLLRRVRLGLLLPQGGEALLPDIRAICQPELGWNDQRWQQEVTGYQKLWQKAYTCARQSSGSTKDVSIWRALRSSR